jgi:hypothetical protein
MCFWLCSLCWLSASVCASTRRTNNQMSTKSPKKNHAEWPPARHLPNRPPHIHLGHGQVIWLLTELGFAEGVTRHTFHVYVKSLRQIGIPFGRRIKFRTKTRNRRAYYDYLQIMELAVALSLRVYHMVPDAILKEIVRYRDVLSRFYQIAYSRRRSGEGSPIIVHVKSRQRLELHGLFLDLNIRFSGGQLLHFGPPRLLPPAKALVLFDESTAPARRFLPLNLSLLAEQVVALAVSSTCR